MEMTSGQTKKETKYEKIVIGYAGYSCIYELCFSNGSEPKF